MLKGYGHFQVVKRRDLIGKDIGNLERMIFEKVGKQLALETTFRLCVLYYTSVKQIILQQV